jgi:hypothetical protein
VVVGAYVLARMRGAKTHQGLVEPQQTDAAFRVPGPFLLDWMTLEPRFQAPLSAENIKSEREFLVGCCMASQNLVQIKVG